MKKVAIIQARMSSTRLPGKVLKEVLNKPLIMYQIERIAKTKLIDDIVVATTMNKADKPIIDLCVSKKINHFCGSENNVLSRYYLAAKKYSADIVIRLTADCPLIDPMIVDKVIKYFIEKYDRYDYVSNIFQRTYPRGMDTEVFSFKLLEETYLKAKTDYEKEHVTPYIYNNPQIYSIANISNSCDLSGIRLTVDTIEDFQLIQLIIETLFPNNSNFSLNNIIEFLEKNPDLRKINQHIQQKR